MAAAKMMKAVLVLPALAASIRINEEAFKLTELELLGRMEEQHATAQAAVAEPTEGEAPPKEDACTLAVPTAVRRQSAWRRSNKCKCPAGSMLQCPGQDCEKMGRYFKASTLQDKQCTCRTDCATNCEEIVEGAVVRNSAWRRTQTCKCKEKEHVIKGSAEVCANHEGRYFAKGQLRDQGCHCGLAEESSKEAPAAAPPAAQPVAPPAPPATQPAIDPDDEEQPTDNDEKQDPVREEQTGGKGAATRVAGGLAASTVLALALAA